MDNKEDKTKRKAPEVPRETAFFMDETIKRLGIDFKDPRQRLFADWLELGIGELGEHSKPLELKFGTLTILCDNGAWATTIQFKKGEILCLIRKKYPALNIKNIRICSKG